MIRRVVWIVAGVIACWFVLLIALGFAFSERAGRQVAERFGASMQASATFDDAEFSLVRGRVEVEGLAMTRADEVGKLSIAVADVRCELPPLGLGLIDRACRELHIGGMRMEVSTLALFRLRKVKRSPIETERVVIEDAVLAFAPSAFLPNLGRVEIRVERAVAGPTRFRSPLSWLFALEELRASFALPGGITVQLAYRDGAMSASGSVFGATPIEVPIALPVRDAADDAQRELARLVEFGRDVAERLVARRASLWLKSKL